jgi:hypothetical protein
LEFNESYSPIGSINSAHLLLALLLHLKLHVLNISNAFQNSLIFHPNERVYLSLPPCYLDWFHCKWHDYTLPSPEPTNLAIQCLKSIQGTCDAGRHWYHFLFDHLWELGMLRSSIDHGIFIWKWNEETCYPTLKIDDILMACPAQAPFLHLKGDLEKLFDRTCSEGSILQFLNLRIIQSPQRVSRDQIGHIKSKILQE